MIISGDDPLSRGAQRFEVFTGAGKRREWPPEVKASIVAECYSGREGVSAVARRHGLDPSQLYAWRRDFRQQFEDECLALCRGDLVLVARRLAMADAAAMLSAGLDGAALVLCRQQTQGPPAPYQQMDHRNHQAFQYRQGLRGPASPMGGRTHAGMAQPEPTPRQGLRADHRLRHRMGLYRFNPTIYPKNRKRLKSR
jgi:hypothetical protein